MELRDITEEFVLQYCPDTEKDIFDKVMQLQRVHPNPSCMACLDTGLILTAKKSRDDMMRVLLCGCKEPRYRVWGRTPSGTFTEWTDVLGRDLDWYREYLGKTFMSELIE